MAYPKIFSVKLEEYVLSSSSSEADHPLLNLKTYYPRQDWQSANTNADQELKIDFGIARSCNYLIIHQHNLDMLGNNPILQGADDSGFTTNVVTPTLSSALNEEIDPHLVTFTAVSRRFWRISFVGTPVFPPAVGNLFLGTSLDFGKSYEFPFVSGSGQFETQGARNPLGALLTSQVSPGRGVIELQFKLLTEAFSALFRAFVLSVRGGLYPFYFQDMAAALYYVKLAEDFTPVDITGHNNDEIQTLKMEEIEAVLV